MTQTAWQDRLLNQTKNRPNDNRSPWQIDRSRIIHAAAFRRLQSKTQIMSIGVNDFYRTRLTHSLEVSQIGTGLLRHLKLQNPEFDFFPSASLIETICLAHDIGHPPFGHGGEIALNYLMRHHGGFEGNAQTLRIVTKLEPYSNGYGMNLTRRTLLGFIKYPAYIEQLWHQIPSEEHNQRFIYTQKWLPAKGVYSNDSDVFEWILSPLCDSDKALFMSYNPLNEYKSKTIYKSLDSAIMEYADDIAYAVHDLEDAIATGTLSERDWYNYAMPAFKNIESPWLESNLTSITHRLFSDDEPLRKDAIGELVNIFIINCALVERPEDFQEPLLKNTVKLSDEFEEILKVLKQFVYQRLIREPKMQQIEFSGQNMLIDLFDAFSSDPMRLLPYTAQSNYQTAQNEQAQMRVLADYLSGMTDEYARRCHARLFGNSVADF
ncbi:deoxyguanosinetriphosphate triphosphohydrolase family protein [Pseudoalteromonas luteoviolacea]|uniref:anti-phage deoxyguanosine triphosphatase n=1 Tax=Pseudoalteromonas luteoviolacea TaxID=43657 RepID=UPI001B396A0E|nr:anti-phage deoxyguanosine triphosphatase [Pseudoalteromonas luteoviolacea]MBQ4811141.1 deoxyguanosinetriphosphate triphosphohydrolase family protein [Pseudoalteromonas luteoviolacea]